MSDTRDWDKEMAEIDKVIAKTPPAAMAPKQIAKPGGVNAPAPSAAAATSAKAPSATGAFVATWFRTGLAILLAVALPVWPFASYCGTGLGLYLAAVAVAAIASLWAASASWRHRRAFAHTLALLALGWAVTLATFEVLPRIGYAKRVATWACTTP